MCHHELRAKASGARAPRVIFFGRLNLIGAIPAREAGGLTVKADALRISFAGASRRQSFGTGLPAGLADDDSKNRQERVRPDCESSCRRGAYGQHLRQASELV